MVAGFGLGAVIGYFAGAFLGCEVIMPTSNLCGVGGAFVGLPLGGLIGAVLARRSAGGD